MYKPHPVGAPKFYGGSSKSHPWCQNLLWQKHVVKETKQLQSDATKRHMAHFAREEAKKVWPDEEEEDQRMQEAAKRAAATPPRSRGQSAASGATWGSETSSQAGLAATMCVRSPKFYSALERSARDAMRGQVGRDIDELKRAVNSATEEQFFTNLKLDKLADMIKAIPPPKVEAVKIVVKKKRKKKKKSEFPKVVQDVARRTRAMLKRHHQTITACFRKPVMILQSTFSRLIGRSAFFTAMALIILIPTYCFCDSVSGWTKIATTW